MASIVGILIAIAVAIAVYKNAVKHEYQSPVPLLWAIGVGALLIVFLPAYFIARHYHDKKLAAEKATQGEQPAPPSATTLQPPSASTA